MKFTLKHIVVALAAGAATTLVSAQSTTPNDASAPSSGDLAVVSIATGARGPHVEAANSIIHAMSADPALQRSKITVTPEENGILLTGVVPTLVQAHRAMQIASQFAGDGNVRNAISVEEVFIDVG
jgi:Flp pilus assembly secretin CpaC